MTAPVFERHRGGFAGLVEPVDDGALFGRPQDHITAEDKARAAAEWAALDDKGRLPEGWAWPVDNTGSTQPQGARD